MAGQPFRLLAVLHAADRTGAPLSNLALCRYWAGHPDLDLKILLRRDGVLHAHFRSLAETHVFRPHVRFGIADVARFVLSGKPLSALRGFYNPDYPYIISGSEVEHVAGLRRIMCEFDPHAIYASTTHCGDVIEPLGLSAPVLTHVREMHGVISALDKRRRQFALTRSATLTVVSNQVRRVLVETWNVAPDRISLEPPAIDMDMMLDQAARGCAVDIGDTGVVIGMGSLIERKGPDLFLELAARAQSAGYPLRFIWLGSGPMLQMLERKTRQSGLDNTLVWFGLVDNPYPVLKRAAVLALTSREDPCPRVMIEAAALGVPVVAFRQAGGADQFVPRYGVGKLVPMYDIDAFLSAVCCVQTHTVATQPIRQAFNVQQSGERLINQLRALVA